MERRNKQRPTRQRRAVRSRLRNSAGYGAGYRISRGIEILEPRVVLTGHPLITEFMASNSATLLDGDGRSSDWIEIYNPTSNTIDLADWHLTDNPDNLDKWTFPTKEQSILLPGEYLIVFASGESVEDYIDRDGYLHTDFNLNAAGEYLALTDPDNNIIHEYAPSYPQQIGDVSFGLATNAQQLVLIDNTHAASAIVPTDGSLDAAVGTETPLWTLPSFNDDTWLNSGSGVGVGFDFGDDGVPDIPNGTLLPGGLVGFDLTDPEEDGTVNGTITAGGFPGSPANEEPPRALDNTVGSKWLAFEPTGTYYQFRFAGGDRWAVNAYTITSANDVPSRDPYTWTLSGSNDGLNFAAVDTRTAQDFANRFETRLYEFTNNVPYEYYRFDFLTEFGATGSNAPNSIQMAEIELLSTGPVNYGELLGLDLQSPWNASQTSVYQRIDFDVSDPADLSSLTLEMQYDDGFVAYLNGQLVASANAPESLTFQSNATAEHEDADAIKPVSFNLTSFLDRLITGQNVLAIHALNVDDASPDLLSIPKLLATRVLDDTVSEAYMPQPSPGATNVLLGATLGPLVQNVTEQVAQPTQNQSIVVTAKVTATSSAITDVALHYRVMYGGETTVAMNDNGTGQDLTAGDGIYTGVIPSTAYGPGQMVRWYVTADNAVGGATRMPPFLKPTNSAEYYGTVVQNPGDSSDLPVFEYFVQNTSAAGTDAGTRGSVYFLGEFYDNVFVRRRGGNTTQGRKFEFNDGHYFLFDPVYPRVDEINLNERGAEPTYMRQVLSWDVYAAAGVPASLARPWHTRLNGSYQDVRIFVEQPDSDLLRRTGLDPNGALYKVGANGVENSLTSSTNGINKRTRKEEDNSDLQALVDGVNPNNPNRIEYVFDNVDIAAAINYIAATSIIHDNDAPHKNYHVYRDTEGSQQWTFLPWDKDLTFGLNFGLPGVIGNQDPFSHPFFGDSDHQKIDGKWNRLIDALFEIPSVREMYVRRLRSLMDQLLLPAGSPETSWLDRRIAELTADLQPEIGSTSWLNDVNRITNEYLVERRQHLYVDHSIDNPTYPDNAAIPDAQIGNPAILFGAMDASPASGNQDQEYLELTNPNTTAVDISNWRIEGGIAFTFRPGTVIPAGDTLYITPDVPAFLARTSGPRGGQQLFVQGNYSGHLSNLGEMLSLIAADGQVVDQTSTPNNPTATQQYLRITEVNFNPHDPLVQFGEENVDNDEFEFIEFVNTSGSQTLNLAGVRISGAVEYRFGTIEQVMNATFNQVTDGFTYVDDPFNSTNEPSHAAGARVAGVGPDGSGALRVYLDEAGSGADLAGTSGGWTNTFNVGEGGVYDLSVDYRMIVGQGFESDEFGEVLLQIDGTRIGTNANSSVLHVAGDGQNPSTPPVDSGWRTAQFKVPLTAGSHTLTIGGYNNKSTSTNEDVELYFDNVNLSGSVGELLLEPNERIVVVKNVDAFASRYGSVSSIAGTFFNGTTLPNGTGDVKLDDANGNTIVDFRYDDAWYRRADGRGSSLEIVSPSLDYSRWDSWQASLAFGGTPGSDALATRDVIINEVLANSDAPEPDAIELYNTGQQPVNIGGWLLSDTTNNLFKFVIPSGTVLQPGAYIVFDESDFNPGSGTQATDFALNSLGDDVWLVATSPTGKPTRVADAIAFDGSQVGVTLGRVDDGQFDYDLFPLQRSTLGSSNVEPQVGQVIISEVHYHPADGAAGQMPGAEFIELYNGSTSTQSLTGWQMRGAIDFAFADDTILSSGGIVILVPFDPLSTAIADDFRNRYGVPASTLLVGPFTGQLANSGEVLELLAPLVPGVVDSGSYLVDRVGYRDVAPWPTAADGVGSSLQRNTPTAFGDRAGNWFAASPTPGIVSFLTGRSTDFDQNGVVNATDLSVWAQGLESSTIAAQETGDADGDLDVDGRDFLAWQRDFGVPATVLSTASAESTLVETSLQRGTARSYRSALRPTMPEAVDQAIAEAYQQSPGMRQARPLQSARSVV